MLSFLWTVFSIRCTARPVTMITAVPTWSSSLPAGTVCQPVSDSSVVGDGPGSIGESWEPAQPVPCRTYWPHTARNPAVTTRYPGRHRETPDMYKRENLHTPHRILEKSCGTTKTGNRCKLTNHHGNQSSPCLRSDLDFYETAPMFRTYIISFESFYNQLRYSSPPLIKRIKPPYLPA